MGMVLTVWLALIVLALIVWLGRLVFLCVVDRMMPPLRPDRYADLGDDGLPTVSFVVGIPIGSALFEGLGSAASHPAATGEGA